MGFEPTIPAFERAKKLDRAATVIGLLNLEPAVTCMYWAMKPGYYNSLMNLINCTDDEYLQKNRVKESPRIKTSVLL
jgi:hypothetical protein